MPAKVLALIGLTLSLGANAATVTWYDVGGDLPGSVGPYTIVEYNDASIGGGDWSVSGSGGVSGSSLQLWLYSSPSVASTTFTQSSSAVAFMMDGDGNDGYAQFLVDGTDYGTFDMYQLGGKTLVISGLEYMNHEISVAHTGLKNPLSSNYHVAIYGGGALSAVPLPAAAYLFGSALLGLAAVKRKRAWIDS